MDTIQHTTVRRLLPEEWDRLKGLPLTTMGMPDAERCIVLVAETPEQRIVGTWVLVFAPFLEGLWVDEDYRKRSSVAARMVKAMKQFLTSWKVPQTYTFVQSEYVQQLAERVGFEPMNGTPLVLTLPVEP